MLIESASLQALGFAPAEIFLARLASGRLVVPVQLGEEQVYFLIDTGIREAVVLSLPFAESRGFLVLGRQRLAARRSGQPQVEVADIYAPPSRRHPAAVVALGLALVMTGALVLRVRK